MKKMVVLLMVAGLMIGPAFAHPGGTDGSGHYDRSTGEYHYHHGYSAHDHVDGVCPYDYDDRTGENSGTGGGSGSGSKKVYSQARLTSIYQTLQKGDRGNAVADLQRRLNSLGYSVGEPDGVFGARTQAAVKKFQNGNGINATGSVSFVTLKALFPELAPAATARPTVKPTARPTTASTSVSIDERKTSAERDAKMTLGLNALFALVVVASIAFVIVLISEIVSSRRRRRDGVIRREIDSIERQLELINTKVKRSKMSRARVAEIEELTEKIRDLLDQMEK